MTILVTGVRGRVGRAVLDELLIAGEAVRAASSRPEALDLPGGVESVRLGQGAVDALAAALAGVRKVFLYAERGTVAEFVAAAKVAGVEHVVLLSSLSVEADHAATDVIAQSHLAVEEALLASGIDWTFLRPGGFATNALQWSGPIRAERQVRMAYPEYYSEPVHELDIADVAVRALLDDRHRNTAYRVVGPESLSARAQVERIADAIGEPIRVTPISHEQQREELLNFLPGPITDTLLAYQVLRDGVPRDLEGDVRAVLGRSPRDFAQWAKEHAEDFR